MRDAILPIVYFSIDDWTGDVFFEVRTVRDPRQVTASIRVAVANFDHDLLITDMKTQEDQIDQNIYQERLTANLSSLFALLALVVACIGLYGLLSYQVTRRTQEIGVRLALGAQRSAVLRLVIGQGALLIGLGAAIGIVAAFALTRYLQSFLFGVEPSDPLTFAGVMILLVVVGLLACFIPARRAANVDPMVALRYE